MAVKLRLMRMGKKKQPTYRVVAADSRSPRNGRFIEILGTYDPRQEPSVVKIDTAKANDWISKGAKPTEVVARLIKVAESQPAAGDAPPSLLKPPSMTDVDQDYGDDDVNLIDDAPAGPDDDDDASRLPLRSPSSTCSSPPWSTTPTPSASIRSSSAAASASRCASVPTTWVA